MIFHDELRHALPKTDNDTYATIPGLLRNKVLKKTKSGTDLGKDI